MATRSSAARPVASTGVRMALAPPLLAALVAATAGAVLLAAAPALPVAVAGDGAGTAPAFAAGPLLAVLALAPAVLAWLLAARGRSTVAAGLLCGLAALAPGRAALDLLLVVAPWRAARPELAVATSLAPLRAGAGAWTLLAGHLAVAAAGVLAVLAVRRTGPPADAGVRTGSAALTAALCVGAVAAAGLVAAPFRSADPYLAPRAAADAPALTMLGLLLVAGAVVLAASLAASAADIDAGRGGLVGVGLGVAAVALPPAVAAAAAAAIRATWGPWVALAGAAGLVVVARLVGRAAAPAGDPVTGELSLPALHRLHAAAGAAAAVAGLFALLGAAASQVRVPAGAAEPVLYPTRLLVPAGLLLLALGGIVLVRARTAAAALARPVLAVAWAAMALAGTAVLDAALTAIEIAGVRAGVGLWAAGVALLAALVAGALAAVAGGVERDEVDLSELRAAPVPRAAGAVAAVLAVPAFGLPPLTAPDFAPAGLWSNFGVASWGLLAAAAAVMTAALLAPNSRPPRAIGLLLGAAAVVALHLAEVPLTGDRAGAGASVAAGAWFAAGCLLALLAGAGLAARRQWLDRRPDRRPDWPAGRAAASTLRGGRTRTR